MAVIEEETSLIPTTWDVGWDVGDESGLAYRLASIETELGALVADLDPARLDGAGAAEVYGRFAALGRLTLAGKTLLAPRIEESGIWKGHGEPSASRFLASIEGITPGQARRTLEVGERLLELPRCADAMRAGELSEPKLAAITASAVIAPESEATLLDGAGDAPIGVVTERCRRVAATASGADPVAATRRIHADRSFASWIDAEGAFCFRGRDTADRGAALLARLDHTASHLAKQWEDGPAEEIDGDDTAATARKAHPARRTLLEDALIDLVTGSPRASSTGPANDVGDDRLVARVVERHPTTTVMVRVDLTAFLRGHTESGECCEIDGAGPIPVAMARAMASDSFLAFVFHRAGDIRSVSHFGRTVNATLRTALAHRDRGCVVPGCTVMGGLEIDHVVPFAEGGPTELDNLALLCHHHHFLKTYEGWSLTKEDRDTGGPIWRFEPLPAFGREPDLGLDGPGSGP